MEEEFEEIDEYIEEEYEMTNRQRMIKDKIRIVRSRTWMRNCMRRRR